MGETLEPHHSEQRADPSPTTEEAGVLCSLAPREYALLPMSPVDAHVDNIISATQGDAQQHLHVMRAILHSVDKVF